MSSASLAVQKKLFAALSSNYSLSNMVNGIYDGVMPNAIFPYVTIGADLVIDWSHKTGQGREHRVSISVWDSATGAARAKTLLALVEASMLNLSGTSDGHRIASVLFLRSFVTKNPDGATQGIAEFRIRTEQI